MVGVQAPVPVWSECADRGRGYAAHYYVHTTSTARGISLGIFSAASDRGRSVDVIGSNQPHFALMGVKIPLMKLGGLDEWRSILQGQVVSPDRVSGGARG